MKRNLILTGFMGSGKSTLGLRLSYRLRIPVVDTDKRIEQRAGRSIPDIFAREGEEAFREKERACLEELQNEPGRKIISTGGGLPLRAENREALRRLGIVFYLRAKPETIWERLRHDTGRPLLQTEDPRRRIRELLAERSALYEAAADEIVDVDGREFDSILREIVRRYDQHGRRRGGTRRGKRGSA